MPHAEGLKISVYRCVMCYTIWCPDGLKSFMPDNKGSVLYIDYGFHKTDCTFLGNDYTKANHYCELC